MKKIFVLAAYIAVVLSGFGFKDNKAEKAASISIFKEAYIYGLPLVLTDLTRIGGGYASNQFSHLKRFPDHTFKLVVRPNNDTYYSLSFLDLGAGPVILELPDTKDRYAVFPLMDAWTNVFASFGKRTTGTKAQKYLIANTQWKGKTPKGIEVVKSPTDLVWIIARIQVNSQEDGKDFVAPIQDGIKVIALADFDKAITTPVEKAAPVTYSVESSEAVQALKAKKLNVVDALKKLTTEEYFNYLNELLVKNPALPADKIALEKFAAIGVKAGTKFSSNAFNEELRSQLANLSSGVLDSLSVARKNVTGKVDLKPDLTIGHYGTDYQKRAAIAYFGLGALGPEEAGYLSYVTDDSNQPLNGDNNYVIHFEPGKPPPSKAFWSITLYDKGGYLTENAIRRYAIGDRSNLKYNADGSLDIYVQHDSPGEGKENNWLPSPKEVFNLSVRIYWPTDDYLKTGNWVKPPIRLVK